MCEIAEWNSRRDGRLAVLKETRSGHPVVLLEFGSGVVGGVIRTVNGPCGKSAFVAGCELSAICNGVGGGLEPCRWADTRVVYPSTFLPIQGRVGFVCKGANGLSNCRLTKGSKQESGGR